MKMTYYCPDSHYNTVLQLFCYGGANLTGLSDAGTKRLVATQKQCALVMCSDLVIKLVHEIVSTSLPVSTKTIRK